MNGKNLCIGVTMGVSTFNGILGSVFLISSFAKSDVTLSSIGALLLFAGFVGYLGSTYKYLTNPNNNISFFSQNNNAENNALVDNNEVRLYTVN